MIIDKTVYDLYKIEVFKFSNQILAKLEKREIRWKYVQPKILPKNHLQFYYLRFTINRIDSSFCVGKWFLWSVDADKQFFNELKRLNWLKTIKAI